ncbi:bifunctional DNA-formamidopyrimidine glycosylase/DNA-(apurinic or apyrimidinic site) lyase [Denitromonas iodatirespirans]|uniref:Formamidopyrimidine-DNA glycosylase n=1 Tax=Denitromonas iodatirespirans TaxID=2795389 RepID=A0A944D434_DENI1|nr:bifunctional DNA-formamidopyrimidine glycosylase/DNA-(apurinic or apyrimidinic site) lyase [Denitromonas iodatirespirans]MBT0959670.1 bifunctional DNA-formamidopyrimidine glycosylase/DNA-(apurinic or apyrimidinic site) lyase [Denitromonas iodatirespirans]
MPELPEVETTRRGLAPHLLGHAVRRVTVRCASLRQPIPASLPAVLTGQTLQQLERRAKYLLFGFEQGVLLAHLGMSGSLQLVAPDSAPGKHDHVDMDFGHLTLRYRDPRRFGMLMWLDDGADAGPLRHLGIEPLDERFDGAWLHQATRGRSTPIKTWLMDNHHVVGIGNIYASESLFRARIHPLTPAGHLGPQRCARLATAIRETLEAAIAAGGSTLRDFVGGDGRPGYFQQQYFVYGRTGEPCRICQRPVQRIVQGQRASFLCAHCQRR